MHQYQKGVVEFNCSKPALTRWLSCTQTARNSFGVAHTSPYIHHINTPLWIHFRLPTRRPSIALTLILRILEYPLPLVYELLWATQKSIIVDTAIRIDDVNPAGVYLFTHALTTYRRLHDMYSATFKRKPSEGVGHSLPKHSSP